jgi:hypothetical protein
MSIAITGLMACCLLGCEAAPVPQAADATEAAPSPPPPAPPAEPAVAEAPKPKASAKGDAVIEAARKAGEAKRAKAAAGAAAGGEPPADAPADAPPADAVPMEDGTAPPDGELSKAEVGVGAKGQGYGGAGFVTTPIEAMFRAEERIRFEAQIPENLKIYKAAHDNKGPATHEEFMQVIIEEGGIPLPELPQGSEYWYDVETEQLMVRTPKPAE